jgi:23S rRNA (cytidine1920-2'-O)/16S rRNA (cytidine1409-2'-O)-methyltransferase
VAREIKGVDGREGPGHDARIICAMTTRQRADRLLMERGLFESRSRAQAAIAAGRVTANGIVVRKASDEIPSDAVVAAEPAHPFVSRGGVKLAAALDHFAVDVRDRTCLDVGASTGGFAQVLVLRGARRVYAVDVGRNQLHSSLRSRPEIVVMEETDIRSLHPSQLSETPDFTTIDVSFISLRLVLPFVSGLLKERATIVALIKPQFETSRRNLKKGIVRDRTVQSAVCDDIAAFLTSLGWRVGGIAPSAIPGGDGNQEFFVEAQRG